MRKELPELPADGHISDSQRKTAGPLQEARSFYENIHMPEGWHDTIDPEEYFRFNEETRHHLDSDRKEWKKWQNYIGHLACLCVIFVILGIHFTGIHEWALVSMIFGEREFPPLPPLPEECRPFSLGRTPKHFKENVKKMNKAIKEKKWRQTEKLLEGMLNSREILNKPDFHMECLYCAVKTLVLAKKYDHAWKRFVEIRQKSGTKNIIPYSVMYAVAQAKYEKATKGSYGSGMPVTRAAELMNILGRIRADYAEEMDKDKRILLFEADALLSSLGKDGEKFDIKNQKNMAVWEQFESALSELLRLEQNTRAVIFLQYRKWSKVESFCRNPFLFNELIVIGKYTYDEADAEKMQKNLLNKLKAKVL